MRSEAKHVKTLMLAKDITFSVSVIKQFLAIMTSLETQQTMTTKHMFPSIMIYTHIRLCLKKMQK